MPNQVVTKIKLPNGTILDIHDESAGNGSIRYATTADWNSEPTFIPDAGQVIIYSDARTIEENDEIVYIPGVKIGDGLAYLIDLPFCDVQVIEHISDTNVHVTNEEKTLWNNKLNYSLSGENLVFNRL